MPTPVKDLVNAFEARSSSPASSLPSPTPARFLRHPARRESAPAPGSAAAPRAEDPVRDGRSVRRNTGIGTPLDAGTHRTRLSSPTGDISATTRTAGKKHIGDAFGMELGVLGNRSLGSSPATVPNRGKEPLQGRTRSPVSANNSRETIGDIVEYTKARPLHRQSLPASTNERANLSQSVYSSVPSYDLYEHESTSAATIVPTPSPFTPLSKSTSTTDLPLLDRPQESKKEPADPAQPRQFKHKPIPAKDVFSRKAGTLYLPHLDDLLSKISPPKFDMQSLVTPLPDKGKGKGKASSTGEHAMFPPLQKLKGKTLEELHHNSGLPPIYADKNLILNSVITTFIGVLVWYHGTSPDPCH